MPKKGEKVGFQPETAEVTWVKSRLQDGEWHLVRDLVEQGMTLHGCTRQTMRNRVNRLARSNYIETEYTTPRKRQLLHRIRLRPGTNPNQKSRTCSSCGKSNLLRHERIRKDIRYFFLREDSNGRIRESRTAGAKSVYLCLPCARHEVEVTGGIWYGNQ